jgi:hypothetical protein
MRLRRLRAVPVLLCLLAGACGGDDDTASTGADPDSTQAASTEDAAATEPAEEEPADEEPAELAALRVPEDFATIQEAVDAAEPGDLILIGPGTYTEAVVVETENLVIRGLDRNTVVLDGQDQLPNGFQVFANGVAIENLTVHNFTGNGIFFTGDYDSGFTLAGYRASYITAYNNGVYGIYAFNAREGRIDNSYGSGHPDSAFYIGQCKPCDAVVTDVVAEYNALGYSGTNSSGNLFIINSEWRNNRVGLVPNTLDSEQLAPQGDTVFAGNYIHSNGFQATPLKNETWDLAFGVGLVVAGGNDNVITKNLVMDNSRIGIAVAYFIDQNLWEPVGNRVEGNQVAGSGEADLALLVTDAAGGADGNCYTANTFTTSLPADIEVTAGCGAGQGTGPLGELFVPVAGGDGTFIDYTEAPVPPAQDNMPDAATAPGEPAVGLMPDVDLAGISVPTP